MDKKRIEILSIIDRLSIFDAFSTDEKEKVVAEEAHFRVYNPNDMLIRKGTGDQSLFIILSGSVSVFDGSGETLLAVLKAGDIFGEMAFLTDTRRTAHVIAREPVIAVKLDRVMFEKLPPEIREKFKDKIIEKLVFRLDTANRELARLSSVMNAPADESPGPFKIPVFNRTRAQEAVFLTGRELIRKIIASTESLPAMPEVVAKVQQMIRMPATSPAQLAKVIEADPAIVAGVLKVANSAYYGFRGKVSSIQHASSLFGTRRLAELITALASGGLLGKSMSGYGLKAGDLWRHAIAVAVVASEIAAAINSEVLESAYMAGLLHDVGKLILDPYVHERNLLFERYHATYPDRPIQDAERDILGFDHAVIASILCETWNLPRTIAFGIRHHHQPSNTGNHELAHIIHLADCLVIRAGLGIPGKAASPSLDAPCLTKIAIAPDTLTAIMERAQEYVESMSGLMGKA